MTDLSIATVQTSLHWENIPANLAMFDELLALLSGVDVIVLPEMFSTGFSMRAVVLAEPMSGRAMMWMQQKAKEKNAVITGSLILYEGDGDNRHYYNRMIWMRPDGSYEHYDKKHLFSLSQEPKAYTAGTKRLIVEHKGWRICTMVCYDLRFPVWSRNAINPEGQADYDVLIYSANWPDKRELAWKTLLQARAIENLSYVIGVNRVGNDGMDFHYTGQSSVIDPLGAILYRKEEVAEVATHTLSHDALVLARRQFQFLKDADAFDLK